eukprot:13132640-Alexandrium_andersonii.AAC.1
MVSNCSLWLLTGSGLANRERGCWERIPNLSQLALPRSVCDELIPRCSARPPAEPADKREKTIPR